MGPSKEQDTNELRELLERRMRRLLSAQAPFLGDVASPEGDRGPDYLLALSPDERQELEALQTALERLEN